MTTKVTNLVCFLLFRLLLPLTLLAACVVRYNSLSFIYLVFLLICPLLQSPNQGSIKGGVGVFLKIVITVSTLGTLSHVIFHIVLAAIATKAEPYGYILSNCSSNEKLARQIAVERLDGVPFVHVLRLVFPDVIVLAVSVLVFIVCYKMLKPADEQQQEEELPTVTRTKKQNVNLSTLFTFLGEILLVLFLAASGIIVPSAIAGVYFLSFLYIATWWALYKNLGSKFAIFRCFVLVWSGLHVLVLHLYQFQFFQEFVSPDLLVSRILGLTSVIETDCSKPWSVVFHDPDNWPNFVNPAIVLTLYIITAVETRNWLYKKKPSLDVIDGESALEKRSGKRRQTKTTERQVLPPHQESQTEHLVDAQEDNPSYSSFDPVSGASPRQEPGTPPRISPAFDEDEDETDGPPRKSKRQINWKRPALVSFLVYVMKQSYVLTLIAMMAWSITFHSWLTFVLLLGACIIWMFPSSRRVCYLVSPFIVLYGEVLLIIQYVYGMNLKELPDKSGSVELNEIGFQRFSHPCLQLALQLLFTSTFWMTMRQFMRDRSPLHPDGTSEYPMGPVPSKRSSSFKAVFSLHVRLDSVDGYDSSTMQDLGAYVWSLLTKYWIFVCSGMMLLISVQDVVVYRIIYLVFFLYFVLAFQLSYRLWRCTMYVFWWLIILYSMAVLIMLYTYQFSDFPQYWKNSTGLPSETLADIGLETFDTAGLFEKLLTPTSFLIVVILQVHYFHKPFLNLSDINKHSSETSDTAGTGGTVTTDTEGTSATDGSVSKKSKNWKKKMKHYALLVWNKGSEFWKMAASLLWRILHLHIHKVVLLTIFVTVASEVSAVSAVYVVLLSIMMPLTGAWLVLSHLTQIWTALVLLSKTIYQLSIVEKDYWFSNCTMKVNGSGNSSMRIEVNPFINGTIDNAKWVGFTKTDSVSYYLRRYIAILLLIVFERIVHYHQQRYYNQAGMVKPRGGIIFFDIKRSDADRNLIHCAKYFANYFFYKFGLEICYIMMAVTISVRVDVYSVIYAILLGILLCLDRRGNAKMWPVVAIIILVLLPVQYLVCLGFPPGLCIVYPWLDTVAMDENLEKWLFLPNYFTPLDSYKLLADFFLLLFVCLQWRVFRREKKSNAENYEGGDNSDILPEVEANAPIPVEDFTSTIKSYLDLVKNAVFFYMYWVTMFVVFLAGTSRINLFSMGYVIAVFCFMWYGQEFLLKPLKKIRKSWNFLIGYTFLVLFFKAALQLLGCVYIHHLYENQCWLIQLLGLTCLSPAVTNQSGNGHCLVEEDNTGLMWDVICFTFLLLQLRIYNSHYFRHIVASSEAQHNLAARGAELINSILVQDVKKQKEDEQTVLYNIKKKMAALKSKQAKVRKDYVEPEEHFQAIRSGDYYLFEEEEAIDEKKPDSIKFGQGEESDDDKVTPMELVSTALDSGMKAAVEKAKESDEDGVSRKSGQDQDIDDDFGAKDSDEEEEDLSEDKDSVTEKLKHFLQFLARLFESFIDSIIDMFNDISKNYRMVANTLEDEMRQEKQKIHAEKSQVSMKEQTIEMESPEEDDGGAADGQPEAETVDLVEVKFETPGPDDTDGMLISKPAPPEKTKFESRKPKIFLLLEATYYVIISRSEMVCYFLMILNQILYASLLSLPLPLMVFLWGMLSVPRPSKTFWITVITYTEAVVVVKYLFQFGFFPWNDGRIDTSPFYPPRILGIEQRDNYASADLVLLLALFIHRSILKRYGLWKDAEEHTADLAEVMSRPSSPSSPEADADVTRPAAAVSSIEESQEASLEDPNAGTSKTKKSGAKKYFQPFKDFYQQLTNPMYNATTDVYAAMFFCDFINFLIIVFGYWAFGPAQSGGGGSVTSYIKEDRVPSTFLVMLVTQFILIIIDRGLYLKKNVLGKFLFQIILVTVLHIWLFFILPYITDRKFTDNIPAQLWYFVKCVYFGLSAYQIRSSYPTRILGNFLTKKYSYLNLFLFKGFLAIPFLLELRVLMDWMWTDTTMAIGSWLQMEDIYANIYVLKCWRESEKNYPTPRGNKKRSLIKYGMGGSLLVVIIFIIWFPLVIFSLANTVYVPNPPLECTVTMAVGGFQPLFKMTAQSQSIHKVTESEYNSLKNFYSNSRDAIAFITTYEPGDMTKIQLNGNSTSVWGISPPSQQEMINTLNSSETARMEFYVTFTRSPNSAQAGESLRNEFFKTLEPNTQHILADIIRNTEDTGVEINDLFPRFIHLGSKGQASEVKELLQGIGKSNVTLSLGRENNVEWWRANEIVRGGILTPDSSAKPSLEESLTLVTFNDRVAPEGFSLITGYGIIGLYLTFILLIGRLLRLSTTGLMELVTYRELPYVDNILQLCLDLYLVREMREYRMEEDLYAKLVFALRSSETRIKWTRLPRHLVVTEKQKVD